MIPILINHSFEMKPIGKIANKNNKTILTIQPEAKMTEEKLFNMLDCGCIIIEKIDNYITKAEILYINLS